MPPELVDSIWALAIWAFALLLLPKRDLSTLAVRIRAVSAGRRFHAVGPPRLAHSKQVSEIPFGPLLVAEAPRILELGVPLWIVSLLAEVLGTARRHEERARSSLTPAGLLAAHLRGQLSRRDMHKKLVDLGQPLPAPKAQRAERRAYTTPPMAWLRERQREQSTVVDGQRDDAVPATEMPPAAQPKLEVQTLGTLRVTFGGEDLTAKLFRRPTAAFVWQCGLVRAICVPDSPTSRDWLADELYAGLDPETQRARLRHRLYDLQQALQGPLANLLKIDASNLLFDLKACTVDVVQLFELGRRVEGAEGLLSPATVAQVSAALAAASGEVLPDWEDLEQAVTGGRGTAGAAVREVRRRIQATKVVLLVALGDHCIAARDPTRAADAFEEALALQPERPKLARKLAEALDATGQRGRADEIRRGYSD